MLGLSMLVLSCSHSSEENILSLVDDAIRHSEESQFKSITKADSISNSVNLYSDPDQQFKLHLEASESWMPLDLEKSLHHLNSALNLARFTKDSLKNITDVKLRLASVFNSQGSMLKEACDIYDSFSFESIPDDLKTKYFILGVQLNRSLSERAFDKNIKNEYEKKAASYRDSVLKYDPKSTIIAVNKLLANENYTEALALLKSDVPSQNKYSREMAPYYHYISEIYSRLQQKDSQIYYLSLSAVTDLRNGIREYKSLPQLADLLKDKNADRAFLYINQSQKDAEKSHSELRQKELAASYREIHTTHTLKQQQQKYLIIYILLAVILFSLLIIWILISLKDKNKKLKESARVISKSKQELESINLRLKDLNAELSDQSKVKEHYVRSFMELSLSYLAQMERFRAELAKVAAKGDWKKLSETINSSRFLNREVQGFFDSFDTAFLSIYPNYIIELNKLLKEEHRYSQTITKLNTELRIYALIKLGITESNQISKFLRCSESTVYNYRTKMRNRAFDREHFETEFMHAISC